LLDFYLKILLLCLTTCSPIIKTQHSLGLFNKDPSSEFGQFVYSLSGHTHGGQLAMGKHAFFTTRGSGRYVAGSYETAWGDLYVSRGIGTSVIPLRIGARPEIVLLDRRHRQAPLYTQLAQAAK
jgi:hypothetical protein